MDSQSKTNTQKIEQGSFDHLQDEVNKTKADRDASRPDDGMRLEDIQNPQERLKVPDAPQDTSKLPSLESFFKQTETEKTQDDLMSEILNTQTKLAGESDFTKDLESELGVNAKSQRLAELRGQMEIEEQKFANIEDDVAIDARGRDISAGFAGTQISQRKRIAQRDYLVLAAQTRAQQGMYNNAKSLVQEAVQREFADDKLRIDRLETAYKLNADRLGREDSKKAQLFQLKLQEEQREYEAKVQNKERIYQFGLNASANGADQATVKAINNAETAEEALAIGGEFSIDPQFKLQKEQFNLQAESTRFQNSLALSRFDYDKATTERNFNYQVRKDIRAQKAQAAQTAAINAQTAELQRQDSNRARIAAEDNIATYTGKIQELSAIVNHPGMNSNVGAGLFDKRTGFLDAVTGKGADFRAILSNTLDRATLDELINAKANGATFGALSNEELGMLKASATAINAAMDDNGKVNMTEAEFTRQVGLMQTALGGLVDTQEISLASPEQTSSDIDMWDSL